LDHEDKLLRQNSEKVLDQELFFSGYLGLSVVLVPLRKNITRFARVMHNKVLSSPLNKVFHYQDFLFADVSIITFCLGQVPCLAPPPHDFPKIEESQSERDVDEEEVDDTWHW
jgi:hypothetical protein